MGCVNLVLTLGSAAAQLRLPLRGLGGDIRAGGQLLCWLSACVSGGAVMATPGGWPHSTGAGASLDRSLPSRELPGGPGASDPQGPGPPSAPGGASSRVPPGGTGLLLTLNGAPASSDPEDGAPTSGWGGCQGAVLTTRPAFSAGGRLRLAVLPEDRLQMKWRESEGSSLGYLVQVKPRAGRGPRLPSARTDGDHGQHGGRCARLLATLPPSSPSAPLTRGSCGRRAGPLKSPPRYPTPGTRRRRSVTWKKQGPSSSLALLALCQCPAPGQTHGIRARLTGGRGAEAPGNPAQTSRRNEGCKCYSLSKAEV